MPCTNCGLSGAEKLRSGALGDAFGRIRKMTYPQWLFIDRPLSLAGKNIYPSLKINVIAVIELKDTKMFLQ